MRRSYSQIARILLLTAGLLSTSLAQSPEPQQRKKIKDFGSSLKRLKWDAQKNALIELPATEGVAISEGDVIRIDTSLVSNDLLVLDPKGNAVSGLTGADFLIRENGVPQTVGHFFTGDNVNVPRMIVLLIDYSASQAPYLGTSIKAAKVLVDKLGPKDLMAIVSDDVELVQDFTSDKGKLKHKLTELYDRTRLDPVFLDRPGEARYGLSKQYSALMATLKEAFTAEDIRPIVIFQTDGDEAYLLRDSVIKLTIPEGLPTNVRAVAEGRVEGIRRKRLNNDVAFSLDDLYRTVENSRVTLYTVIPGPQYVGTKPEIQLAKSIADKQAQVAKMRYMSPASRKDLNDSLFNPVKLRWDIDEAEKLQSALAEVASSTGGWTAFLEKPDDADTIYSRIFTDINQRYIVGYYPTDKKRDGKRRKIDVQVKGHPEYQILGRLSYFAPAH